MYVQAQQHRQCRAGDRHRVRDLRQHPQRGGAAGISPKGALCCKGLYTNAWQRRDQHAGRDRVHQELAAAHAPVRPALWGARWPADSASGGRAACAVGGGGAAIRWGPAHGPTESTVSLSQPTDASLYVHKQQERLGPGLGATATAGGKISATVPTVRCRCGHHLPEVHCLP